MKYRKKPVVIEAWNARDLIESAAKDWNGLPDKIRDEYEAGKIVFGSASILIATLEGTMHANADDKIICGVKGELYPCKPDIFESTYELHEPTIVAGE